MSQDNSSRGVILSEGLVVAAVPAIAYVVAYRFEAGFCEVFGIPTHLIQVGVINVLTAFAALVAGLSLVFWIANLLYAVLASTVSSSPLRRSIVFAIALVLYILALILLARPTRPELAAYGFLLLLFWFLEFGFPLLTQRATPGYLNKLAAQEKIEGNVEMLFDVFIRRIGRPQAAILLTLALLFIFAHAAGRGQARRQRDFLVPASEPRYVVLRQYGDRFVLGRLEEDGTSVSREFRIVIPEGQRAVSSESFLLRRIGPLKPTEFSKGPSA